MKKVMYICLILVVLGGVGVGVYFLKSGNSNKTQTNDTETTLDYSQSSVSDAYKGLSSISYLTEYESQSAVMTKLDSATNLVFFAPTKKAVDDFVASTALSLTKYLPYHVVIDETNPVSVTEGAKLKTEDGQEVIIVKVDGNLYVRDAKGNDVRLRKPITVKNGAIYIIDKVLLTQ